MIKLLARQLKITVTSRSDNHKQYSVLRAVSVPGVYNIYTVYPCVNGAEEQYRQRSVTHTQWLLAHID